MKKIIISSIVPLMAVVMFSCGNDDTYEGLEPEFSADIQKVVSGEKVSFLDESAGQPSRWQWEFEGGIPETSDLSSPEVIYTTPGKYKVKLSISRGDGQAVSIEKQDYISVEYPAVLTADFEADKVSAYETDEIQFTDLTTGFPTRWNWEFIPESGQTITSADRSPKLFFPAGLYTVKLSASNAVNSDVKTRENYLEVIDQYAVIADFTVDHKICYAGMPVIYSDASLGTATGWQWTFEGATPETASSDERNPRVVYATAGKHKVTLVASNENNSSTKTVERFISVIPGDPSGVYFFEGDATDIGPNKVHGEVKIHNNSSTGKVEFVNDSNQEGRVSAKFTRQSYIEIPYHQAFYNADSDFTYSFWLKVTLRNTQLCAYMHGGVNLPTSRSQNYFRLEQHHDVPTNKFASWCSEANVTTSGSAWCEPKGEATLDDGQWHHIVTRREGLEHTLYIDGILAASRTAGFLIETSDNGPLLIGCMADNNLGRKAFFEGWIDDFVVYKRALTEEEIAILYNY